MNTVLFAALATGDAAQGYRATFPDAPDCAVQAASLPQLLVEARQALAAHLQRAADAGEPWPEPTPIERVTAPPGAIPLLVDVSVEDTPVRVNISLGERLLQRLDAAAEARGMTRSGFIALAVRVSLGERGAGPDFEPVMRRLQDEFRTLSRRINDSLGPGSSFARRMNELDDQILDGVRNAADSVSAAMARRRNAKTADAAKSEPPPAA